MNIEQLKKDIREIGAAIQADILASQVPDKEKLARMFYPCFINTAETTAGITDDSPYVITGDIPAMWLRDSTAQVRHYLPYANQYSEIADFIKGIIHRHFHYIQIDSYANAFNTESNDRGYKDKTDRTPWTWERKYEVDSLCYSVLLLKLYIAETNDTTVFNETIHKGLNTIVDLWITEQDHNQSPYSFERFDCVPSDTLTNEGKGTPVKPTGMTWSGFRPSDDACRYGYLVPANFFAADVLVSIKEFATTVYNDTALAEKADTLRNEILQGIQTHAVIQHPVYGSVYAYEVDGFGNQNIMDDANVPSLLSLPYISKDYDPDIYQNTRQLILSTENPYYYEGKAAKGIGSPHTPDRYIWHIALSMQGLTSTDEAEKKTLLATLLATDADTGFMHEGFHCDDPNLFTRDWFAWSNSLFSEFVIDYLKLASTVTE